MKKQQSGFTLIELVVVIVILGILAATAVPRFADLTDNANLAVSQGIVGAISSAAVVQLGTAPVGQPKTFNDILTNTAFANVPNPTSIAITGGGAGGPATITDGVTPVLNGATCGVGANTTYTVTIGGQTATGNLDQGLCSG